MDDLKKEKSCGCIIIEENKVLLIKGIKEHWGFPKGHMEIGETEIQTALREVKEETNLDVKINEDRRYSVEYITDRGTNKQLVLFLAKKISGNERSQESEIKAMEWMTFEDAVKTITYDNTRELFNRAIKDNR